MKTFNIIVIPTATPAKSFTCHQVKQMRIRIVLTKSYLTR